MSPEQIGKNYDTITHLWSVDCFNMENGINQHKKAISFLDLRGKALDIGCGCTGRIIDLLAKQGFEPEGIDISAKMITLAKNRHPQCCFSHTDVCTFEPSKKYDFITAWDSIWHIPLSQQVSVLSKLIDALNPNGILIFSFGGLNEPEEHYDDTMGPMMYYSTLGKDGYLNAVIERGCAVMHLEFDNSSESHAHMVVKKLAK